MEGSDFEHEERIDLVLPERTFPTDNTIQKLDIKTEGH